ncbi:MAG: thioredoxin family protein [Bacteroidales bacterium]|nr:thioredoxin family protein [Bacteroidales bacterium]
MTRRALSILLMLVPTFAMQAQIDDPVQWDIRANHLGSNRIEIVIDATIERGWHLYSTQLPEGGPLPTTFSFDAKGYRTVGPLVLRTKPHKAHDEVFDLDLEFFEGSASFAQVVELTAERAEALVAVEYQVCFNDKCVFLEKELRVGLAAAAPVGQTAPPTPPASEATQAPTDSAPQAQLQEPPHSGPAPTPVDRGGSLWAIIIEAILWGFAALLTPCVFPMVPMTVSFFLKGSENRAKSRFNATVFGVSIIALYTLPIALIILGTYIFGGESVTADIFNWLSTHWLPNILFFLIFMVFAASFFGAFEIVLPSSLVNKADSKADKGGIMGSFFMALTLVLVSFSCTGPIVGSIVVKSTQGEIWEPIISMLAFSAAFALPFTLLAFFPSWLKNLPKSGGWLNSVKVVLGFIEVALGFKFLGVADQVYHWGLLDREVYLAVWIVCFSLLGLYLLGKLKFKHDSNLPHIGVTRLALAIASFSFVVYMLPGMWGAPLKALSGYLPPQQTLDFDLMRIVRENAPATPHGASAQNASSLCEQPKYADFLHLPHGLQGYFDFDQAMRCAKEQHKPLFIDFTGHGCVNCREMEANVWGAPRVLDILRREYVVVALYIDDKTTLPEAEWSTSTLDGKVKKTIGKKYADFQISRYNVNAQPYYILMDHHERTLVPPRSYSLNVEEFVAFLQRGVEEFRRTQGQ